VREIATATYAGRGLGNIGAKSPAGRHNRKTRQFCIRCGIGVTETTDGRARVCDDCRTTDTWFVRKVMA
jgi:NADH pyrophosphatase NudC (nudix superfamily)